jgi:cyclic pyranopterin phosphate synthase
MKDIKEIGFYSLSNDRAKNISLTSQMKRCEMIITEYCNFKCPYCRGLKDEIYGNRKKKELTLEEIKYNIDLWCENIPLENIRFSGGEPTLHKDIIEIVSYAKEKGIKRIAISTNGSNKLSLYKKLIEVGCNDFSISLDACCAEDGDKMSGNVKGSFDIVVKNIEEISKLTYVTVGVVLTPENIDKTIDTIRFAHKLGVADIRIITASM